MRAKCYEAMGMLQSAISDIKLVTYYTYMYVHEHVCFILDSCSTIYSVSDNLENLFIKPLSHLKAHV